jgi:hypothetical protein
MTNPSLMNSIEMAVRYTTWFGKISDAVIPLYILVVLMVFVLWNRLSSLLYHNESTRRSPIHSRESPISGSPKIVDPEDPVIAIPLPLDPLSSTSTPLSPYKLWYSTHPILNATLRLLTLITTIVFYVFHQDIISRLAWLMKPSLHFTIILHVAQYIQVSTIVPQTPRASTSVLHNVLAKLIYMFLGFIVTARHLLNKLVAPKKLYYIQCFVGVVACCYVFWVFANNEPLTRPVKFASGVPRKMCPSNSPEIPFKDTFQEYVKFHNAMLKRPFSEQRFLVFHAANEGLGNRLEGFVSAFVLAMLTDRAFVVDWRAQSKCNAQLGDLFQKPGFEWQHNWYKGLKSKAEIASPEQQFYYAYCRACPVRTRKEDLTLTYENLLCEKSAGIEEEGRVVHIRSTQWFAPVLAMNPHLKDSLCSKIGPDIFGTVSRELLRLTPHMKQRVDDFKESSGWTTAGQEIIALQIRRLEGNGVDESTSDTFLRCAGAISQKENTKYFLATDHIPTRTRFKKLLGDRLIHVDSEFDRNSRQGIQDALLEMWLLGEANNMIMSPYSTYGDVAHARTSMIPHKVGRNGQCTKQITSQPCFFYYFGLFDLKCWKDDMVLAELTNQEDCYI